ncbi:MAG: hypothetical protein JWO30_1847 [Fibrobacteres bacterium]|nr:hypothetical protein [Fibrobacterota bacterium]
MNNKKLNTIKTIIALSAPLFFAHCGQNPAGPADRESAVSSEDAGGVVHSTILLGKVGALGKTSTINLSKLILTAVSNATPADTVRDTALVSGNAAVTVVRSLTLKPLRNWTLSAKTVDALDSVIHSGTTASFFVKPADTTAVSLNLASKYSMYQANFNSLPDSIASTTGAGKDKLNVKRVVLKVDGVVKDDSIMTTGYFAGGQNVSVYFDYVGVGSHTVTLEAYGDLHTYSGILYTGTASLTVDAGNDATQSVTLGWVGPTTGTGKLSVTLGKVGKVIVNGTLPGTIL